LLDGFHIVRDRTREGFDIRRQRRVETQMTRGMLPHDIDHRGPRLARIMQVGKRITEPGPQVQQGSRRPPQHARVAIGRAGAYAFEETQHAAHRGHAVERRYKLHLGGAGIHEAGIDPVGQQGAKKTLGSVHG